MAVCARFQAERRGQQQPRTSTRHSHMCSTGVHYRPAGLTTPLCVLLLWLTIALSGTECSGVVADVALHPNSFIYHRLLPASSPSFLPSPSSSASHTASSSSQAAHRQHSTPFHLENIQNWQRQRDRNGLFSHLHPSDSIRRTGAEFEMTSMKLFPSMLNMDTAEKFGNENKQQTKRRTKRNSWWSKKSMNNFSLEPKVIITDPQGRPIDSGDNVAANNEVTLTADGQDIEVQQDGSDQETCIDFDLNSTIYCYSQKCVPRFVECFAYAAARQLRVRCKLALHICRLKCHQKRAVGAGAGAASGAAPLDRQHRQHRRRQPLH